MERTLSDILANEGIGSGDDRITISSTGDIRKHGAATQWLDVVGSVLGLKLYDNKGTVDYDWEENAVMFASEGDITKPEDRIIWNIQKDHNVKIDSELRPHIHFVQSDSVVREFTIQYRIQANGVAKETTWNTITATTESSNLVFDYVSGSMNQILLFPPIDWSGYGISSTVNVRCTRTDAESGDLEVTFIDAHVELDSDGSDTEFGKA